MPYSGQDNQCLNNGKVGRNTVEYTTTFLYFDWLSVYSMAWSKYVCLLSGENAQLFAVKSTIVLASY